MAYSKLWRGSYGGDVYELQRKLNQNGYKLDVDGGYGVKTQEAVFDYQRKNGLAVDGIVGNETWGSLLAKEQARKQGNSTGKQVLSGVSDETSDRLAGLEQGYKPSDEVSAAEAERQSIEAMKPGEYVSSFDAQLEAIYNEMTTRKKFSYHPEEDAAYHRYADIYRRQGAAAMEDTLGKSAALSGGYDSSYAQLAAQQTYQRYMQDLAQILPQLEANARAEYDREGQTMQDSYTALQRERDKEYEHWQDRQEAWNKSAAQAQDRYESLRDQDYKTYALMLNYFQDKAAAEQKASDGVQVNSGKPVVPKPKKEALSSTASASLERAMGNYLKGGDEASARSLAQKYAERMTPAQKRKITALFGKYGVTMAL